MVILDDEALDAITVRPRAVLRDPFLNAPLHRHEDGWLLELPIIMLTRLADCLRADGVKIL